ncbi:class I SAM-dependent methyltransferase [Micromonospora sp. AMSO1212t]|uniref:Methyltransferase domain-containing protein n=2 Tax=Micromonospora tulbaghiae TaxID=479978 RepID=A0ABY0KMK2_9ACTN|nr:class I SAM-dependent methyltransferase [Micromonospora sp. AMSO1212t]SCE73601.1 Methyltransferase domain-containing protein [Micromonospora tulbaghiae]
MLDRMADTAPPAEDQKHEPVVSEAATNYDRGHGGEERGREVGAELAPHLVPGPVAEVGTGTGLIAFGLRELGHPVVGVDIDGELLTGAYARLGPSVVQGDAQALPFATGSLSNLVYVHVLHLLDDMPGGLAEAVRVLRPGGRLVAVHGVPTTDLGDMAEPFAPLVPLTYLKDEPHWLDPAAEEAGLRLVHRGHAGGYEGGMSPAQYAYSIEKKFWSYLTDMDDETWRTTVVPVIDGLRALPDPDRERNLQWHVHLGVYARD